MSKETVKVVEIDTNPAVKSLKELRKELKDYKDEMTYLEEGSDAFLEVAKKAGEVKHQIDEINESIKGASDDFGDMLGNMTNVAAGLTGAFQAVAGGLQAIGVESEAVDKAILKMQGLMAVTQGLSAVDNGIKSWNKLSKAISGSSAAMKVFKAISNPTVLLGVGTAVVAIGAAWNKWGDAIRNNLPWLDEWIKKLDGTTQRELELLKEREDKFNEYYDAITKLATDIKEKRLWETLTPEAQAQIKQLKDDVVILEAEIAELDKKKKATKERTIWEDLNSQANTLLEKVRLTKNEIDDLYNNPKYKKKTESKETTITPPEKLTELTPQIKGLELDFKINPQLSEDEMRDALKKAIEKGLEKLAQDDYNSIEEKVRRLGDKVFETLEETTLSLSDSSLGISAGWINSLNEFQDVFNQTMDIVKNDGKNTWQNYTNVVATSLSGIGTVLNTLSNEQDASNEKGFEQMKRLQIAATIMNMLSGIMNAWTSAMSPSNAWMTVYGQIAMGTAMSGLISGIGATQIEKIKNQTMQSANPNTNINAKAVNTTIIPPVQYSSAVQGANTEGAIKNQKVVVLESDIVGTIEKVNTQVEENTY